MKASNTYPFPVPAADAARTHPHWAPNRPMPAVPMPTVAAPSSARSSPAFGAHPPEQRAHMERQAMRFREAVSHSDAVNAATANGHQAGYRDGYVRGTHYGMWAGAVVGCMLGCVVTAGVYALRAWAGTL